MTFEVFSNLVHDQFESMAKDTMLFDTGLPLWETYLAAFPEGTNPIFKTRTEHDCSCCRNFVKNIGNIKTAAGFRWKEELITDNTVNDIYNPRRAADTRNDMWTVFNRAPESLVRGGVRVGPNDRKARALGSISSVLDVNTQLWALTE